MKKLNRIPISALLTVLLLLTGSSVSAGDDVEDLKAQIEALQKRVNELENTQQVPEEHEDEDSRGFFNRRDNRAWDPFDEIRRMQEEMDSMFQQSFGSRGLGGSGMFSNNMSFDQDFDLKETDNGYEIRFDMTGLDKDKVDIDINEHSITVKGEQSRQDTEEGDNTYFRSQSYGSFMKTIPLPVDADTTKVKTEKEGDSLVIRLPKKVI